MQEGDIHAMSAREELSRLYPMVQIRKGIWEIDEFDCASIFLIIGEERALMIDTGFGIGDIRGVVEMLTDKPITLVISHSHIDHFGGAYQFEEAWVYENSPLYTGTGKERMGKTMDQINAGIRDDIRLIASRQKGHLGYVFSMYNLYGYDIDTMYVHREDEPKPVYHPIRDGQSFDLGGRVITCYFCPGHAVDELVFLDETDRILFSGDAINYNTTIAAVPLPESIEYLRRVQSMHDRYDVIYNSHHDFRAFGRPLGEDCLPNLLSLAEDYVSGNYAEPSLVPSFWDGQRTPRMMFRRGGNFMGFRSPGSEPPHVR